MKFHKKRKKKYQYLLTILIVNFILAGFLSGNIGRLLLSALFLCAIVAIVKSFCLNSFMFWMFIGIAVTAFLLEFIGRLGLYESIGTYSFIVQGVYAIYSIVAIYLILRNMRATDRVTADIIRGGICVYLLIGFVWAFIYGIIASIDTQAFSHSMVETETYSENIYFSFTTLTTVGYGDVTPVSSWAKMFANLEAIVGQIYPSVFLSILVSEYLTQRNR